MSGPIKAGDLVMVVRPASCCHDASGMGLPFRAMRVVCSDWTCSGCGYYCGVAQRLVEFLPDAWIEERQLIKIDPPAEHERIERGEELTA